MLRMITKTFFLTAWLWDGWSRWGLQPHKPKFNVCCSQLQSELTAGSGGHRSSHPVICILGRNIVAAFRKDGKTSERKEQTKPSHLFPVLLYIWKSSFKSSVVKRFHPAGTLLLFLRKLLVTPRGFCGRTTTGLIPDSEGFAAWCGLRDHL